MIIFSSFYIMLFTFVIYQKNIYNNQRINFSLMKLINTRPSIYFQTKIEKPEFLNANDLWIKQERFKYQRQPDEAKFVFYKVGKTFGLFTKRIIGIRKNYLVYYQTQQSTQIKGYCYLQNLYCGFFKTSEKFSYLVYLTNFTFYIQIYFSQAQQIQKFKQKISKYVIQLNFQTQYQLSQKIGEGSFSKVFIAKKYENHQQYAIKIVKKTDKNNVKNKESVQNEKLALEKINSQHVSKIDQFFQDQSNFYFILQYIPGKNLMSLIKQNYQFDLQTRKSILKGILLGLMNCHENGIIHRDIKPQNIIINMITNEPKLIDLGLCLILDENINLKSFKRCGTMGYIAPQVIVNNSQNRKIYDCKADIFSFGIVAHLLLFSINPLKGKNYQETFMKNKSCKIELNKDLIQNQFGINLYQFLKFLLQIQPKKRINAKQALNHQFLTTQTKVELKDINKFNQLNKNEIAQLNQQYRSEDQEMSIERETPIPNVTKYSVKKDW